MGKAEAENSCNTQVATRTQLINLADVHPQAKYHLAQIEDLISQLDYPEIVSAANNTPIEILCDLDGIIYPVSEAVSLLPEGSTVDLNKIDRWETLAETIESTGANFFKVLNRATSRETMLRMGTYPGAAAALRKFSEHGIKIHMVTHRWPKQGEHIQEYLNLHGSPFDSFNCDMKINKLQFCLDRNIKIAIDDKPTFIAEGQGKVDMFTLAWDYNREAVESSGAFAADHWLDLATSVLDKIQENIERS
jgi:hypothetical protein